MNSSEQTKIIQWLFATKALRVAPAEQPFWYTSGTLGPYYINTHFLYGSEQEAVALLDLIDQTDQPMRLPGLLSGQVMQQYEHCSLYRQLMDLIVQHLRDQPCDFISGGARRDFFFSICAARLLGKPHVSLFKDQMAIYSEGDLQDSRLLTDLYLAGQTALHVADLVTEASSYTRAWLPGIQRLGAVMPQTLAVVDRNQNGRDILAAVGTQLISLIAIGPDLFNQACTAGLIDQDQKAQVLRFIQDPIHYMTTFLAQHPAFLQEQIAQGGKNRERAERCLEQGYGKL